MVLLGDKAQVEARFSPFGGSANLDARKGHGLRRTCHRLGKHFCAPDGLLGDMGLVESCFGPYGGSVSVGARGRCTVCANVP